MRLITNEELEKKLGQCPAECVTEEYIKSRISNETFTKLSDTKTHCLITLDNGFSVGGESACVKVENYN